MKTMLSWEQELSTNPMVTHILLVRHGENLANLTREFSCRKVDYGLTQRGIAESHQTALWIRHFDPTHIFTSPLRRAVETGEIIANILGVTAETLEEFREINVGSLEGQATSDNWFLHNAILDDWKQGCWSRAFPNGETFEELICRVRTGLLYVASITGVRRAIIVTHGGVLHAIRYGLSDNPVPADSPTCSVSHLSFCPLEGKIHNLSISMPFVGHLSEINQNNMYFDSGNDTSEVP